MQFRGNWIATVINNQVGILSDRIGLYPVLLTFAAAWIRLLPHPPNFTPLLALAFFAGSRIPSTLWAVLTPLLALFVTDLALGLHGEMPAVYVGVSLIVGLGKWFSLRGELDWIKKGVGLTAGALLFFVLTNLWVWWTAPYYSKDLSGLVSCFTLAIPFFPALLSSALVYGALIFSADRVICRRAKQVL